MAGHQLLEANRRYTEYPQLRRKLGAENCVSRPVSPLVLEMVQDRHTADTKSNVPDQTVSRPSVTFKRGRNSVGPFLHMGGPCACALSV